MHVLTLPENVDLGPQGQLTEHEYVCEDRNAAELMLRTPGAIMRPANTDLIDNELNRYKFTPLNHETWTKFPPKNILVIAPIGFGDAILFTPCLRHLKQIYPEAALTVATLPEYRQPYLGLPYVDGFADYPLPTSRLTDFDCVLCLERALEDNPLGKQQHMTDRFAQHLGLGELKDKRADYIVSNDERTWIHASFPRTKKRRIGVQVQAGARCRSYPRIGRMVEALRRENWEVALLGRPGEFRADGSHPDIIDLSRQGLTWRQSAAFLLTCDVVLAPDSSLLHVAGALNVPTVGLFGPFPWKLRTAYYTSVVAIQGHEGCDIAPCFQSPHTGVPDFPLNGPCASTGRCVVLDSILPARILAMVERLYGAAEASKARPAPCAAPPI